MTHEPTEKLIVQGTLAGTAGSRDANHGRTTFALGERAPDGVERVACIFRALEHRDRPRDLLVIARTEGTKLVAGLAVGPHSLEYVLDHAVEAHLAAVFG